MSFRVIGVDGEQAEAERAAAAAEQAGDDPAPPGYRLADFVDRPCAEMARFFDAAFLEALEAAPERVWTAVPSARGWQATAYLGGAPAVVRRFEAARDDALDDWRQARLQEAADAALAALRLRYAVERAPYDPALLRDAPPDARSD